MSTRGYRQPDACKCFGGFCIKYLTCRAKPELEQRIKEAKTLETFQGVGAKNAQKAQAGRSGRVLDIRAWRADGSHENGPIPMGRIPDGYDIGGK